MSETVTIDVNQIIKNVKGNAVKDMLDPTPGTTQQNAPDLTLASLMANALYMGISGVKPKDAWRYFQVAGKIEDAVQKHDGQWTVERSDIDLIEQAWEKINTPVFTLPMYAGAVMEAMDTAKIEIAAKEKLTKSQ